MPNTRGMATFADGGIVGSKPYAASGAYIKRMSDHCGGCRYDPAVRTGEGACPFNALYWDFLIRNETRLGGNARMAMPYRNLARFSDPERAAIRTSAEAARERMGAVVAPG
jgi:deoxyribodipyrimidine photolyase-related protein